MKKQLSSCPHPPEKIFAWTAFDPITGRSVLCHGCTGCGSILSGAVDAKGEPTGPQRYLGPKPSKGKVAKSMAKAETRV